VQSFIILHCFCVNIAPAHEKKQNEFHVCGFSEMVFVRVYLNDCMQKLTYQDSLNMEDFRNWVFRAFDLPGKSTDYEITEHYYIHRMNMQRAVSLREKLEKNGQIELRNGLWSFRFILSQEDTCCCVIC